MKASLLKIAFSITFGIGVSIGLVLALAQTQLVGLAAGEALCVVPPGDSTGPFPDCQAVFTSVQDAVDTAVSGQEIRIATGVYTDVHFLSYSLKQIAYLDKSVTLQGGYVIPFDSPPNPETNPAVLDAEGNGRVIYIAENQNVTLAGLHLINGDATDLGGKGYALTGWGGGIFAISSTLTIKQVTIANNIADTSDGFSHDGAFGGGIAVRNGTLYLHNSTISHNVAAAFGYGLGGGIALENSAFHIENNEILSNTAVITETGTWSIGVGGGIATIESSGNIINNQIGWNIASELAEGGNGGGIYFGYESDQSVTIANNNIFNNAARAGNHDQQQGYGHGGGIYIDGTYLSDAALTASVHMNNFYSNSASNFGFYGLGGGILIINRNEKPLKLSFKDNTLIENYAHKYMDESGYSEGGGAVFGYVDTISEHNQFFSNTVSISETGRASALLVASNTMQSNNDLFVGNRSQNTILVSDGATASMTNTVMMDNEVPANHSAFVVSAATLNLTHPTIAGDDGEYAIYVGDEGIYDPDIDYDGVLSITNGLISKHSTGIQIEGSNSSLFIDGMFWHDVATAVSYSPPANITIQNQMVGDPLFAPDGYHLTADSPARFAGVPSSLTYDVDGQGRPFSNPSFGADEYWLTQQYLPLVFRAD